MQLNTYVEIGICGSYNDGDYRVSSAVGELSVDDMVKLRQAAACAIYEMERAWRNGPVYKSLHHTSEGNHNG